jgi:hypothetical protein
MRGNKQKWYHKNINMNLYRKQKRDFVFLFFGALLSALVFGIPTVVAQVRDIIAPEISDVEIFDIDEDSATVSWTTDEEADSIINYGLLDNYGIVRDPLPNNTEHELIIDRLDPSTTYHFRIVSIDEFGNQSFSGDFKFTTEGLENIQGIEGIPSPEEQAIVEQAVQAIREVTTKEQAEIIKEQLEIQVEGVTEDLTIIGPPNVEVFTTRAIVTWVTDRESGSSVSFVNEDDYNPLASDPYMYTQSSSDESVTEHRVELIGLDPFTKYHFQVASTDSLGITGRSGDFTFTTKAVLPEVVNFRAIKVEETSATLGWETTVPASSVVEYENLDTGEKRSIGDPSFIVDHQLRIPDLTLGTQYRATVIAENAGGDRVKSDPITFFTVKDEEPPIISNVTNESTLFPGDEARIQTIVAWDTDEPSICTFNYREGIAPGVDASVIEPEDENPTEKHVQVIVEFNPSTVYKFWIICNDLSQNQGRTEDFVLFTPTKEKSIIDIIIENFEASFGWVKNIGL